VSGFAYVAFVVDAQARPILGWRLAATMTTAIVLDALERAIWTPTGRVLNLKVVVHHTFVDVIDRSSAAVSGIDSLLTPATDHLTVGQPVFRCPDHPSVRSSKLSSITNRGGSRNDGKRR
jgi:hypothetical protein